MAAAVCERMWELHYIHRLKTAMEPERRARGTAFHTVMAWHWGPLVKAMDGSPNPAGAPHLDGYDTLGPQASLDLALDKDCKQHRRLKEETMACYSYWKLRNILAGYRPIWVEREITATIAELDPAGVDGPLAYLNNEVLSIKPDLVATDGVRIRAFDHKVMGGSGDRIRAPSPGRDPWQLKFQVLFYLHVLRLPRVQEMIGGRVEDFVIHRVKSSRAFDCALFPVLEIGMMQQALPGMIRLAAQRDTELVNRVKNRLPILPTGIMTGACHAQWDCDYVPICVSHSTDGMRDVIDVEYERETEK